MSDLWALLTLAHTVCQIVMPNNDYFQLLFLLNFLGKPRGCIQKSLFHKRKLSQNIFSPLGRAVHWVRSRYWSYHHQCDHEADGCLVWIPAHPIFLCCQSFVLDDSPAVFALAPLITLCLYFSVLIFIPCGQSHSERRCREKTCFVIPTSKICFLEWILFSVIFCS